MVKHTYGKLFDLFRIVRSLSGCIEEVHLVQNDYDDVLLHSEDQNPTEKSHVFMMKTPYLQFFCKYGVFN